MSYLINVKNYNNPVSPSSERGEQHRQHGLHLKLWSLLLGSPSSARIPEGKEQGGNNYIYNPYIHLLAPCQLDPLTLVSPESWDGWVGNVLESDKQKLD